METFTIKNLTFTYPNRERPAVDNLTLSVAQGEFLAICGKSGCGKSTLLRQLKTVLTPYGERLGEILFEGEPIEKTEHRFQSSKIGYVLQSPDNQIVTDKVWHELAFGLESLGMNTPTIRLRVAEMASFFGIQTWFHRNVSELSGGQKQLLNLAAIMAMHPSVLILDEPTSQLDPIAATDFLNTVGKINRELGTTIIITEHKLEEVLPFADTLLVMDGGKLAAKGKPMEVGAVLKDNGDEMFFAMPTPMRIYASVPNDLECPLTVGDGRKWIDEVIVGRELVDVQKSDANRLDLETVISIKDAWFKYEKNGVDIVKGLSLDIKKGELFALVGGNGTGKTTALSLMVGLFKPYRGKIVIDSEKTGGLMRIAALPQNPQALFVKNTVELDLFEAFSGKNIDKIEQKESVVKIAELCQIKALLNFHPYDLSGGEQQRAALAKVLLTEPQILLLDEPTKGLDAYFKFMLAEILENLLAKGVTIVMVSHDVEFCASYADRCGMFFDGNIAAVQTARRFFIGNSFYTTSANRMARHLINDAVTVEDVVKALGGTPGDFKIKRRKQNVKKKDEAVREKKIDDIHIYQNRELPKWTVFAVALIFVLIPLTILFGIYYLDDRKYYIISMLVILETLIPFVMVFEKRKPHARELVIIAVLCSIAVAGRAAFYMLPQFKPVIAFTIIAGFCFGGEVGFLVGVVTGFVSNFFVGQGPWTPWQMFAFGIIGFFAGILFKKGVLKKVTIALCIYGGFATFFIYGFLMNTASVFMAQTTITLEMILAACLRGMPFDLIHTVATVVFLALIAKPMIEKLDRIKLKYGFRF